MKVDICKSYFRLYYFIFELFYEFIIIILIYLLFSHFFSSLSHRFLAAQAEHPPSHPLSLLILSFLSFLICTQPKNNTIIHKKRTNHA